MQDIAVILPNGINKHFMLPDGACVPNNGDRFSLRTVVKDKAIDDVYIVSNRQFQLQFDKGKVAYFWSMYLTLAPEITHNAAM